MTAKNTPENFWSKTLPDPSTGCWNWQGAITSSGYGNVSWHGRTAQAHRLAFMLAVGGIRLETMFRVGDTARTYKRFVLHRCDNRRCCNPEHLFLGSMRANLLDAYRKKRKVQPRSSHVNAKLSPANVRDIRARYALGGVRQKDLAEEFGVSQRAISLVVRNETYMDI